MNLTEREKKIFKKILDDGTLKESQLLDAGYYKSEIAEIKDDKQWNYLYSNMENYIDVKRTKTAVSEVLGKNWKEKYDFIETRKKGRYELMLRICEEDFKKICKIAVG